MTAGHLIPGEDERNRLRRVASGDMEADLVIRGGTIAAVDTGQLLHRDILISGRYIAAVTRPGARTARLSLDASGRFVLPAFIDGRMQVERTLLPTLLMPGELARLVVPRGIVTVVTDPSRLVALCGPRGAALATSTRTPLRLLAGNAAAGRPRWPADDGSGGGSGGDGGGGDGGGDGSGVVGAAAGGLAEVPRAGGEAAVPGDAQRFTGPTVADIVAAGHLEGAVHAAVQAGMDPLAALCRVTVVPARRHGLDHALGLLAPAHLADLLVVGELGQAGPPDLVVVGGRIAAEHGRPLFDNTDVLPDWATGQVHLPLGLQSGSFALPCPRRQQEQSRQAADANATREVADLMVADIVVPPGGAPFVRSVSVGPTALPGSKLPGSKPEPGGVVVADPGRDLLEVAVIDRAGLAGVPRLGLVRGIGLRRGALGVTARRAPGPLVVVGANDGDMLLAAQALEGMGGGFVVVDRGWVRAACPLPVAGVRSYAPWEAVAGEVEAVDAAAADLGCSLPSPLSLLADLGDALLVTRL